MAEDANQPLAREAMAYVLAGGRGSRLKELTDRRAKPAVYFGGKTRIIDFALSNALNSGIRRIGVATQYKAHSLIRHLQRGWNFFRPSATRASTSCPPRSAWTKRNGMSGTADAVYQNIDIIEATAQIHGHPGGRPHLQDGLRADAAQHVDTGRGRDHRLPEVPRMEATGFGVMHVDGMTGSPISSKSRRIRRAFPATPTWRWPRWASMSSRPSSCATSCAAMPPTEGSSRDFGKDIIPHIVKNGKAVAHRFTDSCVTLGNEETNPTGATSGTIDAYWEANIDLTDVHAASSTSTTATGRSGPMPRS
jgi:glucose-1-phosphate adenylyltransferase